MSVMSESVILSHGQNRVTVLPALGASIAGWQCGEYAILRTIAAASRSEQMGCFPLVPYANRIADARLPGGAQLLPHAAEAHSLHGVGWLAAWQLVHQHAQWVDLHLRHAGDQRWPYAFSARLSIRIKDDVLEQRLQLRNESAVIMPAGIGFHPFFPVDPQTTMAAQWHGVWATSSDLLPLAHHAQVAPERIRVADWCINHCHTGWGGTAALEYGTHRVTIAADTAEFLQCYRPARAADFIALEPVTHIPNAHHLAAQGVMDTGLTSLVPGQTMRLTMRIAVVSGAA